MSLPSRLPRWPGGKASSSRMTDLGLIPVIGVDVIPGRVIPVGTPVATLPGVTVSALGRVGPVSVYLDWVR